jgi:hypothetical protein
MRDDEWEMDKTAHLNCRIALIPLQKGGDVHRILL